MMPLRISRGTFLAAALAIAMPAFAAQKPAKRTKPAARSIAPTPRSATAKTDTAQQHFDSAQTYQLAGDGDRAATQYRRAMANGRQHLGKLRAARLGQAGAARLVQQRLGADPA